MHAKYIDGCTTVRQPISTCNTFAAMKIWDECYTFAHFKTCICIYLYNFATQLMTEDTWISKVWLCTFKGMQIGAAYTNAFNF